MRLIAKYGVADIVIVRGLHIVKQHDVFKLGRVSDNGVFSDYRTAADKRAVAHLRAVVNDAGRADIRRGKNLRVACYPHVIAALFVLLLRQRIAESNDEVGYIGQHLPWVGLTLKKRSCYGFAQIEQVVYRIHVTSP